MNYFDLIKSELDERLDGQTLELDSEFKNLGIGSWELVELVYDLEEEIGIEFKDEELLKIKTVKDLLDLIDAKTK